MRTTLLALMAALSLGCASTTKTPDPQINVAHKTPVALPKSSLSQRIMQQRIEEGQKVAYKTNVEGGVAR